MSSNMRGLTVFIADIRNCRSRELEEKRINKEMANIRSKFKDGNLNGYQKKKYVCKLLYMYILGWDIDFGHMEAVNLISSNKYSEKQIGYLGVTLLMHENSDLTYLIINSIRKDLAEVNEIYNCLALHAIANIGGREMAETLTPDVHRLLLSHDSKSFAKKKAALTLLRLYRKHPDVIPAVDWAERIIILMNQEDLGVSLCVTSLVMALAQDNLDAYQSCYAKAVDRLSRIIVKKEYTLDYVYYKVPVPWLQVKLLRLLQYYPASDDLEVRIKLHNVLQTILNNSQDTPKNVQHSNAQNSVLFEAINLAIHLDTESQIVNQAVILLGRFITSKETNLRYLGLETMAHLAACVDSLEPIKRHQDTILSSLRDKDISVRRRGLDLLYSMCDVTNAKIIVAELLKFLNAADYALREEMVLKIAILTERFATEYQWYVNVILQLISTAGDHVGNEVWYRVIQIVTNNEELQEYAAKTILVYLKSPNCHEILVKVGGYILGEFGHLIASIPGASPIEQFHAIHTKFSLCTLKTRALLMTTYLKFTNLFPEIKGEILTVFHQYCHVLDSELQQRASEYLTIATMPTNDLLQTICEEMPPFPERESALLSRLHQQHAHTEDKRTWSILIKDTAKDKLSLKSSFGSSSNSSNNNNNTNDRKKSKEFTNGNFDKPEELLLITGLEGLDFSESSKSTLSQSPTNTELITNDVGKWFSKLLYSSEGVLHENSLLQINWKSEYQTHLGKLGIYFRNKTNSNITSFIISIDHIEDLVINSPHPPRTTIEPNTQIQHHLYVECQNIFLGIPNIRVSFFQSDVLNNLVLKLPIVLTKFMEPIQLNKRQVVFKSNVPINCQKIRDLISGFRFGVLENIDPNPNNIVGASLLNTSKGGLIGCLLRLEPNLDAQMFRLTIRTTNKIVTNELYTLLEPKIASEGL
ncbi:8553_t:CDS:10 [Entrophospora sp. SA101]|nr:8553_t:CDS:10 [Entrophospora sp. SA101]